MTRRPRPGVRRAAVSAGGVLALSVALLGAGAVGLPGGEEPAAVEPLAVAPVGGPAGAGLADGIAGLQAELARVPRNHRAWAELGAAYVQQARLTADPALYAKADGALAESLRLRPADNDLALAAQAALAAARHEFARAVELADAALAVNPFSAAALATKVDGLTELGRYDAAREVLDALLQRRPGLDAFTRASYALELQGDVDGARGALERALEVAAAPADRAFVHHYLGELAWNTGDHDAAARAYDAALAQDPSAVVSRVGRARVAAARGDVEAALTDLRAAVAARPEPGALVELGELLESLGRTQEAEQQYAVVRATQQLFAAGGQVVDAELALFEADHGDPAKAVELAARAYATRPDSVVAQDAYAWALHSAGRSAEALPVARAALRTGLRSPAFSYHLGAVEAAVGEREAARASLQAALDLNPAWSPLHARDARALLDGLG